MNKDFDVMMWICDIQNSTGLTRQLKEEADKRIASEKNAAIEEVGIVVEEEQERGDGYFLFFNIDGIEVEKVLLFADTFCKRMTTLIREGYLSEEICIRCYLGYGKIYRDPDLKKINSADEKKSIEVFSHFADNKFEGAYKIRGSEKLVLIIANDAFSVLRECTSKKIYRKKKIGSEICRVKSYDPWEVTIKLLPCEDKEHTKIVEKLFSEMYSVAEEARVKLYQKADKKMADMEAVMQNVAEMSADQGWEDRVTIIVKSSMEEWNEEFLQEEWRSSSEDSSVYMLWSNGALNILKKRMKGFDGSIEDSFKKFFLLQNQRFYKRRFYSKTAKKPRIKKNIIHYSEIQKPMVYLHAFDYGALRMIRKIRGYEDDKRLREHLENQLLMGLIFFDGVLLHSAELLRNKMVYDIMKKYEEFISDGSIKLLFSSRVMKVDDMKNYLEAKSKEYKRSEYGTEDAKSISSNLNDEAYYTKVLELMQKVPQIVKRDGDGTRELEDFIKNDLALNTNVITEENMLSSQNFLNYEYTLFQLLNLQYANKKGELLRLMDDDKALDIIRKIEELLNGVITAGSVVDIFYKNIPDELKDNNKYEGWRSAFEHRVNALYARVNAGRFVYMEFLPGRNHSPLFNYRQFLSEFEECGGTKGVISVDMVRKVRNSRERRKFRTSYMMMRLLEEGETIIGQVLIQTYRGDAKNIITKLMKDG